MALDLTSITNDVRSALLAGGASPDSPLTTPFAAGIAAAIKNAIESADVVPTTGEPPMTVLVAGTPAPVTGKGKLA
jgi:hypothetical protein